MSQISIADGICNDLYISITGDVDMTEWADAGFDTSAFDGYQVGYAYMLEDPLAVEDAQMTCFGAHDDGLGYFCTVVFGSATVEGDYSAHGAGYWNHTEEELAQIAALEAAAEEGEAEEDVYAEEYEVEYEAYYAEYESSDMVDYEAEFTAWFLAMNPMDEANMAWYEPAAICESVFDEYYGEYGAECRVPETATFVGSWFQPKEADSYDGNFRMTGGMEGWAWCADAANGAMESDVSYWGAIDGAATLTAGAAILAVASLF
jgi:hypothetical protein